ncbi:hypothetical protein H920_13752 [Fukomys damarensis]|uniref:Uncharacterized protein n=1 Tax=Fukomys damarensis TaxID=885580 RepID=A0A091D3Y5_FUKDA|nr:hypothetical protein H920_13752 [Fukomys damarensis]
MVSKTAGGESDEKPLAQLILWALGQSFARGFGECVPRCGAPPGTDSAVGQRGGVEAGTAQRAMSERRGQGQCLPSIGLHAGLWALVSASAFLGSEEEGDDTALAGLLLCDMFDIGLFT